VTVDARPTHPAAPPDELRALATGRAFVDLSSCWKTAVGGADRVRWLHDLLTADIASVDRGESRRSLLLTPTGRIRADVHVIRRDHDLMLLQTSDQPEPIRALLEPYVLSSDVQLDDVTGAFAFFALPGSPAGLDGTTSYTPSVLGPGHDELVEAGLRAHARRSALAAAGLLEVGIETVEVDRIRRGIARMGRDFDASSLPAEAGLEALIDGAKGCFLGQESFARIRDRGHPARVLRRLRADGDLRAGEPVLADGVEVGRITSAAPGPDEDGRAIARVRWAAATRELALRDGRPLVEVPQSI
jgi:folate-binding protein YgfZ